MTDDKDLRTIKDTNAYLRSLVETPETVKDYFWINGIVKGSHQSDYKHTYFTLEDERHSIPCMLSKRYEDKAVYIKNGEILDIYGVLGVFEQQAKITFYVSDVRVIEFDDSSLDKSVMEQLEEKGLFPRIKQDLPQNPKQVAVVTGRRSEALSDFENIYREQNGQASIQLVDTILQGDQAPKLIAERIEELNLENKVNIILLTRGGGRQEDLSVFNSFEIAEAICKSKIPIVTGIGHQRDKTIADRVADHYTNTPTHAAYQLANLSNNQGSISQATENPDTSAAQSNQKKEIPCLPIMIMIALGLPGIVVLLNLFLR